MHLIGDQLTFRMGERKNVISWKLSVFSIGEFSHIIREIFLCVYLYHEYSLATLFTIVKQDLNSDQIIKSFHCEWTKKGQYKYRPLPLSRRIRTYSIQAVFLNIQATFPNVFINWLKGTASHELSILYFHSHSFFIFISPIFPLYFYIYDFCVFAARLAPAHLFLDFQGNRVQI